MDRRKFSKLAVGSIVASGLASSVSAASNADSSKKNLKKSTIVLGADSFAYGLKRAVAKHLATRGITVIDADNYSNTAYYKVGESAAQTVADGKANGAILFCGTGAGMSIVANKISGVFAVAVESVFAAKKAKAINNANVISMGSMIVGEAMACEMVDAWLDTKPAEGFESLKDFLDEAYNSVATIDKKHRK